MSKTRTLEGLVQVLYEMGGHEKVVLSTEDGLLDTGDLLRPSPIQWHKKRVRIVVEETE